MVHVNVSMRDCAVRMRKWAELQCLEFSMAVSMSNHISFVSAMVCKNANTAANTDVTNHFCIGMGLQECRYCSKYRHD